LPFVAVQVLQETVAPLSGGRGPDDLRAAGDRVAAGARAVGALPAQALLLDRRGFGFGADQVRITGTVGFAETVAADDERGGFHIVHGHPAEGFPDIAGGRHRVGPAVGPLRVDIDQAHLDIGERAGEFPVAAVAFVAEPGVLRAPVDLLRFPDIGAAEAETEGLEAHRINATLPANTSRSAQEIFVPYF